MTPAPYQVILELTTGCNFSCAHCAVSLREYRARVMPKEIALRVIDDLAAMDPVPGFLQLSGHGESTILPWFGDIFSYARAKLPGAVIAVHTNGSKLAEYADLLVDGEPAVISVSVDGTGEVHDAIRKKGSFEALVEGLLIIKGLKERRGSKFPVLQLAVVITGRNFEELPKIVYLAQLVGVDVVVAQPLTPYRELGTDQWSYSQLPDGAVRFHNAIVNAQRLAVELGIELQLNFDELLREPETEWHFSDGTKSDSAPELPVEPVPAFEHPSSAQLYAELEMSAAPIAGDSTAAKEEVEPPAAGCGCSGHNGPQLFKQCVDPWFTAFVNVNGSLNTCCYRTTDVEENLFSTRFSEIWFQSKGLNRVRNQLQEGAPDHICRACPYRPAVNAPPYVPDRWRMRRR